MAKAGKDENWLNEIAKYEPDPESEERERIIRSNLWRRERRRFSRLDGLIGSTGADGRRRPA
jgi:hypothetical protein